MNQSGHRLLLVIPIRGQADLKPVLESEGWHTVHDLLRKTSTLYNRHWNGKHVLDQDERPWNASDEEFGSLKRFTGQIVVLVEGKYNVSRAVSLYRDRDGSTYALEDDLRHFLTKIGLITASPS